MIQVDLEKKCLRGFSKKFEGRKIHVGNGILKQSRHAIFSKPSSELSGDGVIMTEPLYRTFGIPLGMSDIVFLQNITSTLASTLLDTAPNDLVLDMVRIARQQMKGAAIELWYSRRTRPAR